MPIPVILDTDIGHDVDDVWALAFLLRCPELDVRLVTTCTGDTVYRARLVAKILQLMGRADIPIGIGIPLDDNPHTHSEWLGDYELTQYPGTIHGDGIGAICETILSSTEQVSLICIGPLPNIAAALARAPEITARSRFVGMHGSIRRGYLGAPKPMREFNVKMNALSCRAVFEADWPKVITPLDTCGSVVLIGERFARLRDHAQDPHTPRGNPARISIENHLAWAEAVSDWPMISQMNPLQQSSILYDTVAVYLGFADELLEMETLPITITPDGKTMVDEKGSPVSCAMNWKNKEAFLDLLVDRLLDISS
jgi:inosine-uridine nucleoside N-ribohydrolase